MNLNTRTAIANQARYGANHITAVIKDTHELVIAVPTVAILVGSSVKDQFEIVVAPSNKRGNI